MPSNILKLQGGATLLHWLVALAVLAGVASFSVDLNDLLTAHTELQKAADAGALSGAQYLYCSNGTINYPGRTVTCDDVSGNPIPHDVVHVATSEAQKNYSQGAAVQVTLAQFGHWTFKKPSDTTSIDRLGVKRGGSFNDDSNNQATAPLVFPTTPAPPSAYASGDFRPVVDTMNLSDPTPPAQCNGEPDCLSLSGACTDYVSTDLNRDPCDINAVKVCVENRTAVLQAVRERCCTSA